MTKETQQFDDILGDVFDIREVIARYEELEPEEYGRDADDDSEFAAIHEFLDEVKGYGGDEQWRGDWYPVSFIRESYFEEYAQELAEDIGAVNKNATWPNNHIDWEAAAKDLLQGYSSVEISGVTYYYR